MRKSHERGHITKKCIATQAKSQSIRIKNKLYYVCQPCLTGYRKTLGVWLQDIYTTKAIISDLQNYSEEHLSTAPWCFLLSFISHVASSLERHQ